MSELNTTAAAATAVLSSAIGFGLAFYIASKINKGMTSKSQKVLVYVAMTSFGLGLMGVLNELIGFPLQGLSIRGDRTLQYLLVNILMFPIAFLGIAFFLRNRSQKAASMEAVIVNESGENKPKSSLLIITACIILGIASTYAVTSQNITPVFEEYEGIERKEKGCKVETGDLPTKLVRFIPKPESGEVLLIKKDTRTGELNNFVLGGCKIFNETNWKCERVKVKIYDSGRTLLISSSWELVNDDLIRYSQLSEHPLKEWNCGLIYRKAGLLTALMF